MNKMKYLGLYLCAVSGLALAADDDEMQRPSFHASVTNSVTAEVTAIDKPTRIVTVRKNDGEMLTFNVPEEARNLDQVEVGDILFAEYNSTYAIDVYPGEGYEPGSATIDAIERTAEGEMPGVAAVETTVLSAKVAAIDLEANTFTLKDEEGHLTTYTAHNPENLRHSKVGDLVVMTVTDSVAITVEHAPE